MIVALAATLAFGDVNVLNAKERGRGWKLLFDGKSTAGWHSFKGKEVRVGWKVEDGTLVCADPRNAGDIVTDDKYDWFELVLDYKLAKDSNSGVMFHVGEDHSYPWETGPEIQLHDAAESHEPQKSGWLYELYKTETKAVKPEEWNRLRIVIAPKECSTELNGVPMVKFKLGSEDFKERITKSKFASMPDFAKLDRGAISLQGDHGVVSFRNIKLRPIK